MHVEAGHSAVPEEGPKDLRCPLCLYHTKYKRNMIDHIVLHREERVVPIEVCRSKLSKYLQGVVFRCDKLFLSKVSRNFELVGRVNLDQLEQMKGKIESSSSDEEEKDEELSPKDEETDPMMFPGSGPLEKRFPCEFCGRSFTEGSEWERHVLRHGMALNECKRRSSEDIQPKEDTEEVVNALPVEDKESIEKMMVDFSHNSEAAASVVAADKPLQENSEAK
ncbi:ZN462 protein, partial [Nothocercus nigrocapillus]|nr:ZN462 protein [Nothocercus nigrocapillus]